MDPNIRNFSQLEKFIKENPRQADAQAFEWQKFLKSNIESSPELYSIETAEEFYKWTSEHPEKNVDPSIWIGKEISDAYYYLRGRNENEQMEKSGAIDLSMIPQELLVTPILAASFLERPKIMEDDKDYQKIEQKLKQEWLKKNPGKDFSSKEGFAYLQGDITFDPMRTGANEDLQDKNRWEDAWAKSVNVDLPKTPTLAQDAEKEFRSNPKFKRRIDRYDKEAKKIYKKPEDDPSWQLHGRIQGDIGQFAQKYPEKAKAYFKKTESEKKQKEEKGPSSNINISDVNQVIQELNKLQEERTAPLSSQPTPQPQETQAIPNIPSVPSRPPQVPQAARAGARLAGQAARLAAQGAFRLGVFLFTTPPGWAILGIGAVFIITFAIVFSVGGGGSSSQGPSVVTPTPAGP